MPLELKEYKDIDGLLVQLARYCITHNLHRTDEYSGGFYYFSEQEIDEINSKCLIVSEDDSEFADGYMFLDDPNGKCGFIQLYTDDCNPEWIFEELPDGEIHIQGN